MAKKYSSYAQIDQELEMLRLKKEIHFQYVLLHAQKTKELLEPESLFKETLDWFKNGLFHLYQTVLEWAIPYAINWFFQRKRGD